MALVARWMITHLGGGLRWSALLTIGLGIFVLWALYGNEQSDAPYDANKSASQDPTIVR